MNDKQIIVSVLMITYNHEKYIAQAIESVLMQKTSFDFEIVIGEDCSKDKTREIVLQYKTRYPNKIKVLLQPINKGPNQNWIETYNACTGKYIALLEGDDYWINPYKLQKQVEFLERNQDYVICFHKVKVLKRGIKYKDFITHVPHETTTIKDLAQFGNFIHTPSVVFRNGLINEMPKWMYNSCIGDYPLYMILAQYGKIKCLNEVMAIYRIHPGGVWSSRIKDLKTLENITEMYRNIFNYYYNIIEINKIFRKKLASCYIDLSEKYLNEKDYNKSMEMFNYAVYYDINLVFEKFFKYKKTINLLLTIRKKIKRTLLFVRKLL